MGRKPEPRCAVLGIRLCSTRCVDLGQLSAGPMNNELELIRLRTKKVINLKAARKLMARRQLAGA